jgi:hypothetical protein
VRRQYLPREFADGKLAAMTQAARLLRSDAAKDIR